MRPPMSPPIMPLSAPRVLLPATLLLTSILASLPVLVPPPKAKAIGSFTAPLDPMHPQSVIIDAVRDWHWPMMHDYDRNEQYDFGLTHAIQSIREERPDGEIVVLDVGAGAGLLSLMAVRAGATRVLAIENSQHMAAIAREAVAANHMADKITVRPPRKDVAKCWARGPDVERCDPLRDTRRLCA